MKRLRTNAGTTGLSPFPSLAQSVTSEPASATLALVHRRKTDWCLSVFETAMLTVAEPKGRYKPIHCSCWRAGGFHLAYAVLFFFFFCGVGAGESFVESIPSCAVYFMWRSARAHHFHSSGQDQYTVVQRSETTVAQRSVTSWVWARFSDKLLHYAWRA